MKKVVFVGQAMPRVKRTPHDWPTLNAWLYTIGLTDKNIEDCFCYTALVNYFPGAKGGSHLVPTEEEIIKERERLQKTITDFNPDFLVTIGKLSLSKCINQKVDKLDKFIGKTFKANPYNLLNKEMLIIPLPHPSGASTWRHKPENKELLRRALNLLKENI